MRHIKLFENFDEKWSMRGGEPTAEEVEAWVAQYREWSDSDANEANVIEFFQNNDEDSLYKENMQAVLKALTESSKAKRMELSDADERQLAKEFTFDGKYAFDDRLKDDEKEALLMMKVEDIIKKKNLNQAQADKVRKTWGDNMKKVGVGEFEEELKRRWLAADKKLTGGRLKAVADKIKDEIWKGYKAPVMGAFDAMADIIAGEY